MAKGKDPNSGTGNSRGITFETLVCMLCFVRGFFRNRKDFRLAYQAPYADKFNDVVFDEGGETLQMIQLKHHEIKTKIGHAQLFHDNFNADYSLLKYVKSVIDTLSKGKQIKNAVVFTNNDFNLQNKNQLSLIKNGKKWYGAITSIQLNEVSLGSDAIFNGYNLVTHPNAKYYKFDTDKNIVELLVKQAKTFANGIRQKQVNQTTNISTAGNERQQKELKTQEQDLLTFLESIKEDKIRVALEYIIYAVGQPNDTELKEIIKDEIKDHFKLVNVDDIYNSLEVHMREWCDTKTCKLKFPLIISFSDAEKFFQSYHKTISFDVTIQTLSFVGRGIQSDKIKELFYEKREVPQTVAIVGLGGIGKTQLAKYFIAKYGESDFYNRVIWISAESDYLVDESFRRLAEKLKFEVNSKKYTKTIIAEVFDYFEGTKVLFVFDNVNQSSESEYYY